MGTDSPTFSDLKPPAGRSARSQTTNGSKIVLGTDGRTAWVRRLRDLMALHASDLGGPADLTEAEKSVIRRAATLTVELEQIEARFASGESDIDLLNLYSRLTNTLRRLLETVGLQRRLRDATPSLGEYLEGDYRPEGRS